MLVNNKLIDEDKITDLINIIKRKKELQELSEDFVREHLFNYLKKNSNYVRYLGNSKSKKYKQIVKDVRAQLRRLYGLFRTQEESKVRKIFFDEWLGSNSYRRKILLPKILETHASTKERLSYYSSLYQKIFQITGTPKKIIDLGSGVNPFSLIYMKLKKLDYYAFDLSESEMGMLKVFFNELNKNNQFFTGHAEILDSLHWPSLTRIKKADICLLFKMTDVLDRGKGHKATEEVIKRIPAKHIIVSFPTITMSGKKMNFPRRKWIELMCKRLSYHYRTLEFSNEIFYIIRKS